MIANRVIGGNGGETASIFVTGLSETDTVTATKDGRTYNGKWTTQQNPVSHGLPIGYTELECIKRQSETKAYIDTGIPLGNGKRVVANLSIDENPNWVHILGTYSGDKRIVFQTNASSAVTSYLGRSTAQYTGAKTINIGSKFEVDVCNIPNTQHLKINGETVSFLGGTGTQSDTMDVSYNLYIFGTNNANTVNYGDTANAMTMYEVEIYDTDNSLIGDFIPCKRNSDNAIGMYNIVSNIFIESSGTGTFVAGSEIPSTIGGHFIDNLKEYGTYTVTATDGTNTTTQDVLVDMATQYDIELSLSGILWLYKDGNECEDVTGGWAKNGQTITAYGVLTKYDNYINMKPNTGGGSLDLHSKNKISLNGFTKLCAEVNGSTLHYDDQCISMLCVTDESSIGIQTWTPKRYAKAYVELSTVTSNTVFTVDISSVNMEDLYCKIVIPSASPASSLNVYKIWLE